MYKAKKKSTEIGIRKAMRLEDQKDKAAAAALELEALKWILVLALSIGAFLIVAAAINAYYDPDITKAVAVAKEVAAFYQPSSFAPEAKEKFLFISGVLVITASLFLFSFVAGKISWNLQGKRLHSLFLAFWGSALVLILLIGYLGLYAANPGASNVQNSLDTLTPRNVDFYFFGTFVYNHFLLYALILFPATTLVFLCPFRLSEPTRQSGRRTAEILCFAFCGFLIILVFFMPGLFMKVRSEAALRQSEAGFWSRPARSIGRNADHRAKEPVQELRGDLCTK
jgi:hypothetical protein